MMCGGWFGGFDICAWRKIPFLTWKKEPSMFCFDSWLRCWSKDSRRKRVKYVNIILVFVVFLVFVVAIEVFPLPNNIIVPLMLSWMIWVGIDSKKEKEKTSITP